MANDQLSELIGRVALGDRLAFRMLYDLTSAKLFGICLRVLQDRTEAEDAVQEVYVKLWRNASKFKVSSYSPMSWLAAIARNHAIDLVRARKQQRSDIAEAVDIPDPAATPEEHSVANSERNRLQRCLAELDTKRAEVIRSAYVEGYSYQELASRHRLPINTLRTWLRRGLIRLRDCLGRT